jgi:hypothetical protein
MYDVWIKLHQIFSSWLAILQYKKCEEYTQYSNCLVTYLDHPSAIFIQIPDDGPAFQKMHQDMKWEFCFVVIVLLLLLLLIDSRYYSNNIQTAAIFEIGDFCVAYSIRYSEFYRARIIAIDCTRKFDLKWFPIINKYLI